MIAELLLLSPEIQIATALEDDESLWARVNRICDQYISVRPQAEKYDADKLFD